MSQVNYFSAHRKVKRVATLSLMNDFWVLRYWHSETYLLETNAKRSFNGIGVSSASPCNSRRRGLRIEEHNNEEAEAERETARKRERERESIAHTETRVLRCFAVYTHSVHHWSSLHEARGSSVPVPIALGIVYKTSASCRAFQSSALSFVFLLSSRPIVPSLSFFPSFSFSRTICFSPSPALSRCSNWMPDNKGDCMYYLACLPHACPDSSQSTFESRHDRYKAVRSQCNAIKSNPPCILSRTWNPYYIYN